MVKKLKLKLVAYLLAVFAGLTIIATYGISLPRAPFAPVDLNGPTAIDSNGSMTVVADSASRRLMLLDNRDRLLSMIKYDSLNTPIEAVTEVCISGDRVYVAGLSYKKDSYEIERERVLAYDLHGAYQGILYEAPHVVEFSPSIKFMHTLPTGVLVGVATEDAEGSYARSSLSFVMLHGGTATNLFSVDDIDGGAYDGDYCVSSDAYVIATGRGRLVGTYPGIESQEVARRMFSLADIDEEGNAYAYDEGADALCAVLSDGTVHSIVEGDGTNELSVNNGILSYCSWSRDEICLCATDGSSLRVLTEIVPVTRLTVLFLLVGVCWVYLAAFAVVFVVRRIVAVLKTGEAHGLGSLMASVAVVLSIVIAIGYTSYKSHEELVATRLQTINTFADYLMYSSDYLGEDVERISDRYLLRNGDWYSDEEYSQTVESYTKLIQHVAYLSASASDNGIGTYTCIYARDGLDVFYLFDSMDEHVFGASLNSSGAQEVSRLFDNGLEDYEPTMYQGTARYDSTRYRLVPILGADGTSVCAVVEIGSRMMSFEAGVISTLTERVASLLVMMVVLYLAYSELRGCGRSLLEYRTYDGHHNRDALALLTRPFTFGVTLLSSIDSVMTVLIAKQLVATLGSVHAGVLVAIPSVMLGIGLALGHLLYGHVGSRVTPRKLVGRGGIAVVLCSSLAVCSLMQSSFWLYCAAKLLLSIPLGTLYSFGYSLPRRAHSEELRGFAQEGVTRTDTSAAAIGTVLGGYAAQMLGALWVYVVLAALSVFLIVFCEAVFPHGMKPLERPHVRSLAQTLRFLGSPSILPIIVFVMLPVVLAGGYDSFMFPLFSSNLGISTSAIHNISAFGKLIVFVSISQIGRAGERFDKWGVVVGALSLMGLTFLLFSFNTTLAWAVIVIALVGVLSKTADGWKALWLRSAHAQAFPRGRTTGMMFAVRSVLLTVQPLVLTLLLTRGEHAAIITLGFVCIVCAILFWFTTRNTDLAPEQDPLSALDFY